MPLNFIAAAVALQGIYPVLFLKADNGKQYAMPSSVTDEGARTAVFGRVRGADLPPEEYMRVSSTTLVDFFDRCATVPVLLPVLRKGGNNTLLLTSAGLAALSRKKAAALQWPAEESYVHNVAVDIPAITGFATTRYRNEDLLFVDNSR